ncbi:hypothetical protein F8M41_004172 [Gigaspora margarita]|uniref:Uncharacterized protein n=1 Tax=Gigaspora margarita TaxID=4874 RepID=A0A8H4A752_GIGMA|nr:hypothetical protein F8M41_004172 [Gigaspora margarita]
MTLLVPSNAIIGIVNTSAIETICKAKIKKAHEKGIPAPPKCKNITPPKNKKISTTNANDNNDFQQSLSDESSSSESFAESSLLLTNKQTTSVTLSNREFWSAPPMNKIEDNAQQPFNTIDIDNNDTQQNSGKNTIEADDNDTQQYSGSQVISNNTLNNSILKSKKIIEKKKSNHLTRSTHSKMTKNGLSKKVAVAPKKQATSNKSKKIKY